MIEDGVEQREGDGDKQCEDVRRVQQEVQTCQPHPRLLHALPHLLPPFSFSFSQIPCESPFFLSFHSHSTSSSYTTTAALTRFGYFGNFERIQVLYWLSGLTCTDENFIFKSGAQRAASTEGLALIAPDTSPSNTRTLLYHSISICLHRFIRVLL